MIWSKFINLATTTSRRRGLAVAVVYGLSLSVRFTSAAGEEVEIAPQSAQRHPLVTIMAGDDTQRFHRDWSPKPALPIVFRHGWPPSLPLTGCAAP